MNGNMEFQYGEMESIHQYVNYAIFIAMPFVEVFRLFMGFEGNLREKVRMFLSIFWTSFVCFICLGVCLLVRGSVVFL